VISAYHRLLGIEKSFRMAKSDLQARPVYHRKRDSIEAHLTIVFAALAGRQPLDRDHDRLEHQEVRSHRPPLPHHHHPGRLPCHHRRRPSPRRPPGSPNQDQ
jgi:hypothetical protein